MFKKYLKTFTFTFTVLAMLLLVLLWQAMHFFREDIDFPQIVEAQFAQEAESCIYSSALNSIFYNYKVELYKKVKPDILVLGSSRVMELPADVFTVPFVNAGGSMRTIAEGRMFLEEAFAVHKPRLILLGVDMWWFNQTYVQARANIKKEDRPGFLTNARTMLHYMLDGKITPGDFFMPPDCHIGIAGRKRQDGFDKGGFYHYTSILTGRQPSDDEHFADTFERIEKGVRRLDHGNAVGEEYWTQYKDLLDFLKNENIEVIIFLPPYAPAAYTKLEERMADFGYLADLEKRLRTAHHFYNFHDGAKIPSTDCEYINGIHPGDVPVMRILETLQRDNAYLAASLDMKTVRARGRLKGRASAKTPNEVDFLALGCRKPVLPNR